MVLDLDLSLYVNFIKYEVNLLVLISVVVTKWRFCHQFSCDFKIEHIGKTHLVELDVIGT